MVLYMVWVWACATWKCERSKIQFPHNSSFMKLDSWRCRASFGSGRTRRSDDPSASALRRSTIHTHGSFISIPNFSCSCHAKLASCILTVNCNCIRSGRLHLTDAMSQWCNCNVRSCSCETAFYRILNEQDKTITQKPLQRNELKSASD